MIPIFFPIFYGSGDGKDGRSVFLALMIASDVATALWAWSFPWIWGMVLLCLANGAVCASWALSGRLRVVAIVLHLLLVWPALEWGEVTHLLSTPTRYVSYDLKSFNAAMDRIGTDSMRVVW